MARTQQQRNGPLNTHLEILFPVVVCDVFKLLHLEDSHIAHEDVDVPYSAHLRNALVSTLAFGNVRGDN